MHLLAFNGIIHSLSSFHLIVGNFEPVNGYQISQKKYTLLQHRDKEISRLSTEHTISVVDAGVHCAPCIKEAEAAKVIEIGKKRKQQK